MLALYDTAVRRDKESDFYLNLVNAASLLWRLAFVDVSVGDRWEELADICATKIEDHSLAFSDLHFTMALAAAGRRDTAEAQLSSMRTFGERPDDTSAATMMPVTIPLAEGILAYANGDPGVTIARLAPIRHDLGCLGGSHAQRDIFKMFLIAAARSAGRLDLARALLAERVAARPQSAPSWRAYAEVLEQLGDLIGSAEAGRRLDQMMTS